MSVRERPAVRQYVPKTAAPQGLQPYGRPTAIVSANTNNNNVVNNAPVPVAAPPMQFAAPAQAAPIAAAPQKAVNNIAVVELPFSLHTSLEKMQAAQALRANNEKVPANVGDNRIITGNTLHDAFGILGIDAECPDQRTATVSSMRIHGAELIESVTMDAPCPIGIEIPMFTEGNKCIPSATPEGKGKRVTAVVLPGVPLAQPITLCRPLSEVEDRFVSRFPGFSRMNVRTQGIRWDATGNLYEIAQGTPVFSQLETNQAHYQIEPTFRAFRATQEYQKQNSIKPSTKIEVAPELFERAVADLHEDFFSSLPDCDMSEGVEMRFHRGDVCEAGDTTNMASEEAKKFMKKMFTISGKVRMTVENMTAV